MSTGPATASAETIPRPGPQSLLGIDAARAAMLAGIAPVARAGERLPLRRALRRVLAEDLVAGLGMPRWPNSAMDGYALRAADARAAGASGLAVSQVAAAGVAPRPLQPGSAARIFTGAPIPDGADTVVMQEHCRDLGGRVVVEKVPGTGANIRAAGEDFRAGTVLLAAGRVLQPQHLALAASAGAARLPVRPRPRVAVIITGDELVAPGRALGPGQIHESNGTLLCGLVERLGALAEPTEVVGDDPAATRDALARAARESDCVLTSGGVSVGDADHVRDAVAALGSLSLFGVALKPGKPVAFGDIGGSPILCLPGNPVSAFVTFALFGAPLLRRLQGRAPTQPVPLPVPAGFEQPPRPRRDEYLRVRLDGGRLVPHASPGSGILTSLADADGLACVPAGTAVSVGDPLAFYSMGSLLD